MGPGGRVVLVVLVAVAVGAGAVAAWPASGAKASAGPPPVAPVFSWRRVPAFVADSVAAAHLRQRLDAALGGRERTCLVVDDGRGPRLYARDPDAPLIPASNLKLLTATAVLARIRESDQFRTEIRARQRSEEHTSE